MLSTISSATVFALSSSIMFTLARWGNFRFVDPLFYIVQWWAYLKHRKLALNVLQAKEDILAAGKAEKGETKRKTVRRRIIRLRWLGSEQNKFVEKQTRVPKVFVMIHVRMWNWKTIYQLFGDKEKPREVITQKCSISRRTIALSLLLKTFIVQVAFIAVCLLICWLFGFTTKLDFPMSRKVANKMSEWIKLWTWLINVSVKVLSLYSDYGEHPPPQSRLQTFPDNI